MDVFNSPTFQAKMGLAEEGEQCALSEILRGTAPSPIHLKPASLTFCRDISNEMYESSRSIL